jgi:hypothetical protein
VIGDEEVRPYLAARGLQRAVAEVQRALGGLRLGARHVGEIHLAIGERTCRHEVRVVRKARIRHAGSVARR